MKIAFHADGYSREVASNRLRMFEPIEALRAAGVDAVLYERDSRPGDYDVIVFSRGFSAPALKIAQAAGAGGTRLVLDMCDNLFALEDRPAFRRRCERLRAMIGIADIVTAPTAKMAGQLESHVPAAAGRFRVIPDALEAFDPGGAQGLAGLDRFHARHAGALHCVWYGSSAANMSGFVHLQSAAAELGRFDGPVTLTVISDTRLGYWRARRSWTVPSFYLPFRNAGFGAALARHDVAVIPVGRNGYTSGKSINRAATAIMAGLGVIADPLESYEPLRPWIALGDWQAGLQRYTQTRPLHDPALAAARAYLEVHHGPAAVARRWTEVLCEASAGQAG